MNAKTIKKTTILRGFSRTYPGQPIFQKLGKKGDRDIKLHHILPSSQENHGNWKITVELSPYKGQ